jgi:phenylalanyl-tRNA synthetase beta chain
MQISLKWLNELVDIETSTLEELIDKLTLGGFEVEESLEIETEKGKALALEISTTPNRADSLSIQGLALEITALLQTSLKTSNYTNSIFDWDSKTSKLQNNNLITKDCTEFKSLTIENIQNVQSPKWLKEKLIVSGLIPENTLVDFQNYILLETGYPIEIYDLDQIYKNLQTSKFHLTLTHGDDNQKFLANNESTYELNDSILVLKANELPISIAGMISNQNYKCSKSTNSLLVEGSIFNAAKIRQQSRTLGLRTIRSIRYEKSLTSTNLLISLSRFVDLLRISNPNLTCKLHTSNSFENQRIKTIKLHYKSVQEILGPIKSNKNEFILPSTITTLLQRLNFQLEYTEETHSWLVTIPEFRQNDIEREIDLIEEIGRLYGFNNFLTRLPNLIKTGTEDFAYQIRQKVTAGLIGSGFNELIQYSLVPEITYFNNEINLINPLVKDYAHLRSSLLPNLIRAVEENNKKNNLVLEGFEYGHIFLKSRSMTIEEAEYVAGIFGGSSIKSHWSESPQFLSWFEGKSKLEELFKKLNLVIYWRFYKPVKEKTIFHPYRTAGLYLANQSKLGTFGQIHPLLAKKLNLSSNIYLFELNFEGMKEQIQKNKLTTYHQYSLYPKIIKDLSFIISQEIAFEDLKKILYVNGSKFLIEINLLDQYYGSSIPKYHTSLCVQFVFQSSSQTLKTKQIEKILDHLKTVLISRFNVTIRT